ncbi:hypothetical protein [Streptomyces sp. NPDC058279]|uniref:hypothetical protein n=1 Tax=Streptomyces sp. NPDC058279 TaxID=3346418 RepID=UPI0036E60C29
MADISRTERKPYWPGPTFEAWRRWRALAYKPGPWVMHAVLDDGTCECCDPFRGVEVRSVLEAMCRVLPRRSARELRAVLTPLDERFLARTLNDPFASPQDPWWLRRLERP